MKNRIIILSFLLLTFIYQSNACTTTTFSGNITGTVTWSACIEITGNVTVVTGAVLTIKPGTTVSFQKGTNFYISGTLNAVGKNDSIITFTSYQSSPQPGDWSFNIGYNNASASATLTDCSVSYIYNITISSAATFTSVTVSNSSADGIYINGSNAVNITGCSISTTNISSYNNNYGINVQASGSTTQVSSTIISNYYAGFYAYSGSLSIQALTVDNCQYAA